MNKQIITLIATACLLVGCARATPQPTTAPVLTEEPAGAATQPAAPVVDVVPRAETLVAQLAKGDFDSAGVYFDDTMKNAAPPAKLAEIWGQITDQVGPYQQQVGALTTQAPGVQIVTLTCQFEKDILDILVTFDPQGQIRGFSFKQAQRSQPTSESELPAYIQRDSFHEVDVTLGGGDWALPGTLTIPNGAGPFPGVILVHGSGPNDRNETIGANQIFRDLAWGLASQGVAVLRYDKRTLVHASQFTPEVLATFTVQEEVIDDVLLAIQLLRQTPEVHAEQIYLIGHSEGGMLAPRIAQQDPALAGLVILAAPSRPLEDLIIEQTTYLSNLDGSLSDAEKTGLDKVREEVSRIKDPGLSAGGPGQDYLLGGSPAYWLDLRGYQPAEVAKTLSLPLLVIQGGRDYQVLADKDFTGWETALKGKANASLKLYPALNHLLIAGEGPSTPQEYQTAGHVSQDVIESILQWIEKE